MLGWLGIVGGLVGTDTKGCTAIGLCSGLVPKKLLKSSIFCTGRGLGWIGGLFNFGVWFCLEGDGDIPSFFCPNWLGWLGIFSFGMLWPLPPDGLRSGAGPGLESGLGSGLGSGFESCLGSGLGSGFLSCCRTSTGFGLLSLYLIDFWAVNL